MKDSIHYDIIVIGSGPGGQQAAILGAQAGRHVAIVERSKDLGGECVFRGTIPSKTLREAALNLTLLRKNSRAFNFELNRELEISSLMGRLDTVLRSQKEFTHRLLRRNNVNVVHGRAKITGEHSVEVYQIDGSTRVMTAEFIVVATGSRPRTPEDIPVDHENILDSDSILSMIYLPRSLTVLGGGVIASEYASIFALLGTKVTIIDRAPRPLMFMDPELVDEFLKHFKEHGGIHYGNQEITSVAWDGVSQTITILESGKVVKSDKLLVALGRLANVDNLGLDTVGIEQTDRGHIQVNANYTTSVPSIYAVGDVIGSPSLAASAMEQGRRAVSHALQIPISHEFKSMPVGIYSVPEMASVGLSEQEARAEYGDIFVGRARMEDVARAQITGATTGTLKLITAPDGKKLLGVHIVSTGAADLIHAGELALLNGNDIDIFLENVLNFPTMSQAYRTAALDIYHQVLKNTELQPTV